MWSQKFVRIGLSTGTAFAAIAVFAAWYVYFAISAATGGAYPAGWFFVTPVVHPALPVPALWEVARSFSGPRGLAPDLSALGVIVYPACWFYRIHRRRSYSIPATWQLVAATYITSCVIVGIVLCLFTAGLAVRDFIPEAVRRVWEDLASGQPTLNWQAIGAFFLIFVLPILGSASFMLLGGAMMLIPFIFVGPALAFLHRWLLLAAFSPPQPSGAASP